MRSRRLFAQAALCAIAAAGLCGGPGRASDERDGKVEEVLQIPEARYEAESIIPAENIPSIERNAMEGSAKDAVRLARHFGTRADVPKQVFWLTIAVENGDRDKRLDLARAYRRDLDPFSLQRSEFWYESIIRDGKPELAALARTEIGYVKRDLANRGAKAPQ